ncbi:protein mini spindles isoform X3 [Chrysoperla carnea]|uniref:protein mini spindles isoform X3 n=1 Tax=Chrysoperla carnea TaxID=189513 RepID=UPI001D0820AD|nr:protein mini spindles isoform X3 [Chrysoperla carnea]
MEDELLTTEFKKLPIEERCVHKAWKARVNGYEEAAKLFRMIVDEKSPEWNKYLGLIKKFVTDSNALGQEKGLEATLVFVENCGNAGKTVGEVMSGIVTKCIAAPKTKTKELATQVTLMYIEIEKQDIVLEELLKGMEHKNPKIVAGCIVATKLALQEFGSKVIPIKPLVKKIPVLLADRDKTVRDEGKAMVVEMYRWIGAALKPQLASLQPVQVTELETEFEKVKGNPTPTRYLRSQQQKQAKIAAEAAEASDEDEDGETDAAEQIDPYDLMEPVDILSKLPKDFYEKVEDKKWQERKMAVESLETLLKAPKLENGDYGDMVRALKKIISKDSNVIVIALAGKCLAALANGLKKRFQPYAGACVPALLEKFREKKQNVVTALREAIDAVFLSTNLENIQEDVLEALNNKNPAVKSETASFLARAFCRCQPIALNKKLVKAYTTALLKTLNEPDPTVRDTSAEALGTLMKLVGADKILPFLADVEAIKMTKIKECCDKAVLLVKVQNVKKERPNTAPPSKTETKAGSTTAKPVKRPLSSTTTKKKPTGTSSAASGGGASKKPAAKPVKVGERELTPDEVEEKASECLSADIISGLSDVNWKARLSAMERFNEAIRAMNSNEISTQVLVRTLIQKPGLKDTNFQVLRMRLETVKMLAENYPFSTITAGFCLADIVEKMSDIKNGTLATEVLTAIAEATKLDFVSSEVLTQAFNQKNPKVQQDSLLWLSNCIKEFGLTINVKLTIEMIKKGLQATSPGVRTAAVSLVGVMFLYMGNNVLLFFENEKPAIQQQLNTEIDKYRDEKPPTPTRGLSKSASKNSLLDEEEDDDNSQKSNTVNVQELLPRVDISGQITDALINELGDKNWKVRIEALTKVQTIINEAKLITSNIADLPQALAPRLVDSNSKIAQTTINLCEALAKAMGPACKPHVRTLFPGFLQGLGDSKTWIRSASISCINAWGDEAGYKEFFDGEMISDALKTGSPTLRTELWAWLAEKLPDVKPKSFPREELISIIPHLYSNLEDRSADVRKNAQEAVLGVMLHLGYESMLKQTEKLKQEFVYFNDPGSKVVVVAALDKARPSLPVKPLPPAKAKPVEETKTVKSGGGSRPSSVVKSSKTKVGVAKPTTRKKEEDVDISPLLALNNLKHQRSLDEQKLKVLKWNFVTPRDEFVDLLRDQMATANVNKTLMANMFHTDFRYHLKAIESLTEDIQDNMDALVANLDLILKWLTLRFFDTNPSVLIKGLEYLQTVFGLLVENDHVLSDSEASSFIPYLILKVGDPKDAVRNSVRALFNQITYIYPASKFFPYMMDGLKSKNARQRTECLDELGLLIKSFGMQICQPSTTAALREIAKQISDRDNSVRNAALNVFVNVYRIEGENVYKLIGQVSDKNLSLLEERIKRAGKVARVSVPPAGPPVKPQVTNVPSVRGKRESVYIEPEPELEPEPIEEDEEPEPTEIIPSPTRLESVMPISPPKRIIPNENFLTNSTSPTTASHISINKLPPMPGGENLIERTIGEIASPNVNIALQAIAQMDTIFRSNKTHMITPYENQFMSSVLEQMKAVRASNFEKPETLKVFRSCLTVLIAFYESKTVTRQVSPDVLGGMLEQLIGLLIDKQLASLADADAYTRVINTLCVRLIERSDHTNVICALIKILHDSASQSQTSVRYVDLAMKCLWKAVKLIPSWADELDFDLILLEIHIFFSHFPSAWWKQQPDDKPIRTMKTVLHTMARVKGQNILSHMSRIPNPNSSELHAYLVKILKSFKQEENKQQLPQLKKDPAPKPLSRAMHNLLVDIFQKIGVKETTKEGLLLLYEFREQHPEVDTEPFLKRATQFFQEYVEKGLEDIAAQKRKHEVRNQSNKTESTHAVLEQPPMESAERWLERLRSLESMAAKPDALVSDENLNSLRGAESDVEILRRRLEQVKSGFQNGN